MPPTAIQIGRRSCAGRGQTPAPLEGGAGGALPVHDLVLGDVEEQVEAVLEVLVVAVEVEPEEGERLEVRPAPGGELRAPARKQVERGEVLEHAHGVGAREHRDRARQADAARLPSRSGEHHRGSGDGEVGTVVLADAEHVEARGVGHSRPLEQLFEPRAGRREATVGAAVEFAEGEDAELERARRRIRSGRLVLALAGVRRHRRPSRVRAGRAPRSRGRRRRRRAPPRRSRGRGRRRSAG